MTTDFIFVYGTLRKETATAMHQVLAQYCEYVSVGSMQGKLYDIGHYPGAIKSTEPSDKVYGELYRILNQEKLFIRLDEYEECTDTFPRPHEYIREKTTITLPESNNIQAWAYIYNYDTSELIQIKSGDYLVDR
ncbi:gamma-glutamylcyclotransferase [Vibrio sp. HA2012]|uniref:gamma-glutamylcyclotransferase family protein n=1 Tax=Vibrio sp. HA2012 TaxID=1971595 RepID=UPI000C2B8CD1|nr:gamma-glutamylcyclotransferase family protein [Vibrio sp. HA2012]PJC87383.1 gamma-glutamylcyclotransferase [Vibrio sp. HA2012]